jgi:hypothetical protein
MNPAVPPPPLASSRQQRPRGGLADNKPFPASLAAQVRSSGPPHQTQMLSRRQQEETELLARQFSAALSLAQNSATPSQDTQHHVQPREPHPTQLLPPPPRCFPPYFPGAMLPPHFPPHHFALPQPPQLFTPYYNIARIQK